MPTYEFVCTDCGSRLELQATLAQKATGLTPQCGSCDSGGRMRRVFSAVAMVGGGPPIGGPMPSGSGCCGGACGCG